MTAEAPERRWQLATSLLGRAVRWRGVTLGEIEDVLLDRRARRLVGFAVRSSSGPRFLSRAACELRDGVAEVRSPHVLLEPGSLAFYLERGSSLAELRGAPAVRSGKEVGRLADLLLDAGGDVMALVLRRGGAELELPARGAEVRR